MKADSAPSPGVEDGGEVDVRARCFGVGGDHDQRLGGGPEQEVVDAACSGTQCAPICRRQG